ncbi:hypothetical protein [Ascidiaceihabitans sp.]|uniref:hypothetical protein n=1 Tax=Ascidiaceihabitans sp. TaxID=1872644 RepID=UPI003296D710
MSIPEDDEMDFSSTAPAPAAKPDPRRFRSLGGGRYEEIDCPTGRCPRVHVSELPFERQLGASDDTYAARLRTRARTATDLGNRDELYAIIGAFQTDVGIRMNGTPWPFCKVLIRMLGNTPNWNKILSIWTTMNGSLIHTTR